MYSLLISRHFAGSRDRVLRRQLEVNPLDVLLDHPLLGLIVAHADRNRVNPAQFQRRRLEMERVGASNDACFGEPGVCGQLDGDGAAPQLRPWAPDLAESEVDLRCVIPFVSPRYSEARVVRDIVWVARERAALENELVGLRLAVEAHGVPEAILRVGAA